MVDQNSIKNLKSFVKNVEEKLLSINSIYNQLEHFASILSQTQENICQDLNFIKNILNENMIEQDYDEIIPIDNSKSEWDDDDDDDQDQNQQTEPKKFNENENEGEKSNLSLNNSSTNEISLTNKRLSNLKKSENLLSRIKSPKSVTFSVDEHIDDQQQQQQVESIQIFENNSKQKKNQRFNQITTPIVPSSSSEFPKENQLEIKSNIDNLSNIRIHEIEPKSGDYLRLINLSNSDDYDLSYHFLQQNLHSKTLCRFPFPSNTILRAGQTTTIWCGPAKGIYPQPPYVFLWKEQLKWDTTSQSTTILAKPNGQIISSYRNNPRVSADQSSSDILFVRSNSNIGSFNQSSYSSCSFNSSHINTKTNRLSESNIFVNGKPPFAHSPNNPIHPDHNGTNIHSFNQIRSQINSRDGISKLLNRPKSSPFASHVGCKQDLITSHLLKTPKQKQSTLQT